MHHALSTDPVDPIARGCATALRHSRFVARAVALQTGHGADESARIAWLRAGAERAWTRARIAEELARELGAAGAGDEAARLAVALRRVRCRLLLAVAVRDIAGVATLEEVTSSMTALAEVALQRTVHVHAHALAAVHGVPCGEADAQPQDLLVVAMGKGGGGELNVSSDLDLVFVYDSDGRTLPRAPYEQARRALTNHEYFDLLGKRVIAALSETTAAGFVFRIDMRLRPNGDAGPLVVSSDMLEEYLVRQGREWERFAWLKGRVISAPVFASAEQFDRQCRALDAVVRPFVFRKYLDFNAIAALRELHAQIRAETRRKGARRGSGQPNHEDDIKLGRGGIREIEFIAQTFQVIRGGRDPRLRGRATLATLATLGELGLLAPRTCASLADAYTLLRRVEHALQYVDDAQTHRVPRDAAERERIAALLRMPSAQTLLLQLAQAREAVAEAFDGVFSAPGAGERGATPAPASVRLDDAQFLQAALEGRGYARPGETAQRLLGVLGARRIQLAPGATRTTIERLVARAIDAVAADAGHAGAVHDVGPDEVLARFVQLLDVVAGRATYVALLAEYPQAFARVLRLLAASRWAADYLARHPVLLDELIDERLADLDNASAVDWSGWRSEVEARLADLHDDAERQMNVVRDLHHAQLFRLLVADLDGRLTVERLADHLSALADATLGAVLDHVWRELPRRHTDTARFAIVGYGKLGGKELGYESDLDLVFVHDDPHPEAAETYTRLARRLVLWLTTQTSSGILFDVDLRLRPSGEAGLPVSSLAAFERYQRNEDGLGAWTWEHQALTRARFCAGDPELGSRIERLRAQVLARPRDVARLVADVIEMRRRMLEGHPNRSDLFDLKHDRGGMVDIEFIVQTLVLAHAHAQPRLLGNLGNIALLGIAAELGLIDGQRARTCADAYRTYRRLQHRLRLNGAQYARVPPAEVRSEVQAVRALWRDVLGTDEPLRPGRPAASRAAAS
jgi:glutamate-ammonia-ligase adenylyltransferase